MKGEGKKSFEGEMRGRWYISRRRKSKSGEMGQNKITKRLKHTQKKDMKQKTGRSGELDRF